MTRSLTLSNKHAIVTTIAANQAVTSATTAATISSMGEYRPEYTYTTPGTLTGQTYNYRDNYTTDTIPWAASDRTTPVRTADYNIPNLVKKVGPALRELINEL